MVAPLAALRLAARAAAGPADRLRRRSVRRPAPRADGGAAGRGARRHGAPDRRPATQVALELSGLDEELPTFERRVGQHQRRPEDPGGVPRPTRSTGQRRGHPAAVRAWTGTDMKIVAARCHRRPARAPDYQLGIAPGVDVQDLADLEGKKIAYSPGQAQGALVLKVLQGGRSDPGGRQAGRDGQRRRRLRQRARQQAGGGRAAPAGARARPTWPSTAPTAAPRSHRASATTPGTSTPTEVVEDADKAAALRSYVAVWAEAQPGSPSTPTSSRRASTSSTRA